VTDCHGPNLIPIKESFPKSGFKWGFALLSYRTSQGPDLLTLCLTQTLGGAGEEAFPSSPAAVS
jgi:hypothetical protein